MTQSMPHSMVLASLPIELAMLLGEAALSAASRAANVRRKRRMPKRGLTLQPGRDTPLWNELVRQVLPQLRTYGSKAQLARILGVPRQRLHLCLRAQTASLDAERTLLLLSWLARRCATPTKTAQPNQTEARAAASQSSIK